MDEETTTEGTEGAEGQQTQDPAALPTAPKPRLSAHERYEQLAADPKAKGKAKPAQAAAGGDDGDDNDEPDAGDLAADGEGEKPPEKKPSMWDKFVAKFGGEKKQLTTEIATLKARAAESAIVMRAAQEELGVYRQALVEAGLLDENGAKLRGFQFRDNVNRLIAAAKKKRAKDDEAAATKATADEAAAKKHADDLEALENDIETALKAHPGLTREKLIEAANADLETAIADIAKKIAPRPPRKQPQIGGRKPAGAGAVKKHSREPAGAWSRYQELAAATRQ